MQRAEQWRRSQKTAAEKIEELLLEQEREDERNAAFSSPLGSSEEQQTADQIFPTIPPSQGVYKFLLSTSLPQLLPQLCRQEPNAPKPEQFGLTYADIEGTAQYYRSRLSQRWPQIIRKLFQEAVPVSSPLHPCHSSLVAYQGACERYFERWRAERDQLRIEERWWETLSGTQFEIEVERLLRKRGSQVSHVGGAGDGGIDLWICPSDNATPIPVQCKAHRTAIGPAVIRDFYGAMKHCGANEGWIIAVQGYSLEAKTFAESKAIHLFTIRDLLREKS